MRSPVDPSLLIERGKTLHRQGKLEEAASIYQQVLKAEQDNADALHLLGVIANQRGEHEQAASLIGKAVKLNPEAEHYHSNLGLALMGLGDWEVAHSQFLAELEKYPSSQASHVNLGVLLQKQGRQEQAIEHYQAALSAQPHDVTVLNNLAFAYVTLRVFDSARDVAQKSLQVSAENPDAWNLLGLVSRGQGRAEESLAYFGRALQLKPDAAEVHLNRGVAYRDLGEYAKALADYDRALGLEPDYAEAHWSRALVLLAQGEFEAGWREYEHGLCIGERKRCADDYPVWHGETLREKTILVCAEQGLGDEIMFASILPELVEAAAHCVLECDTKLVPIYKRSFPAATVIRRRLPGENGSDEVLPHVDLQVPVGSLALYRRNRLEDFPRHTGYLKANPERVAYWKARLDELGAGLKVGISWRGGVPKTGRDRRSIPLEEWLPILNQQGIQFVSLQYTDCREELASLKRNHGITVHHWQEAIDVYDETAALVCALDLVVTVQTAIFHLSGALGRPVWGLIRTPAEWRYLNEGGNLPWYPSARLFRQVRQVRRGEWGTVLGKIASELSVLTDKQKSIVEKA